MARRGSSVTWKVFGGLAAVGAALLARRLVEVGWRGVTGTAPPTNPESPDVTWQEAVGWALLSGAAVGLARLLATRQAAAYWRRSTGALPPGLEDVTP
ncbi:MAG: DUF4235 domain-containing protein [Actinomycetota bacterium]